MNEFSKLIPEILKSEVNKNKERININRAKKYLFISSNSKLIFEKISLFINIFLGLLYERIWFNEYLSKEYTLINLKPELVEKKDPPIITKII